MPVQAMARALGASSVPQLTSAGGTGASSVAPFHSVFGIKFSSFREKEAGARKRPRPVFCFAAAAAGQPGRKAAGLLFIFPVCQKWFR